MPLSIKNAETEAIARRLAELTGETITEAIQKSLEERYARMQKKRDNAKLLAELHEIALRCSQRPIISDMTADEILGYDEQGIPTL